MLAGITRCGFPIPYGQVVVVGQIGVMRSLQFIFLKLKNDYGVLGDRKGPPRMAGVPAQGVHVPSAHEK